MVMNMDFQARSAGLPDSYERVFRRFDATGGQWVPTWNWCAFLFGALWYLVRGAWVKALIYFGALLVFGGVSGGLLIPVIWVLGGVSANYDLYLLRARGTQLWEGAAVAPDAMAAAGVTTPAATQATRRRNSLDAALDQGVVSQAEYDEKIAALEALEAREQRRAALDGLLRSGVVSQQEYDARLARETVAPSTTRH